MARPMGENIQREWEQDLSAPELWDGLELLASDRRAGIEQLTALAEQGSALSMMYLGHTLSESDDPSEVAVGGQWLRRSADAGSIEGRFQLAIHYERQGEATAALSELKTLSTSGYAPATYYLGALLYRGTLVPRNVRQAINYLELAKAEGHLPAMGLLARIYRAENFGLSGRIAAHWNCLAKIPAVAWYMWHYPHSDRLRGFALPETKRRPVGRVSSAEAI